MSMLVIGILITVPVILFSVGYYVIKETIKEINFKFENSEDDDNIGIW